jgi:hypothetical protein
VATLGWSVFFGVAIQYFYFEASEISMANIQKKERKAEKQDSKAKLMRLVEYLQNSQCSQFTGYIKINFSQGHIGRIEKFEEILRK